MQHRAGFCSAILCLLSIAGRGAALDPAATRTTAAEARTTCRGLGYPNSQIDTLFLVFRTDRDNGFSFNSELGTVVPACQGGGCGFDSVCSANCVVCFSAIVAAVYGR